MTDGNISDIPSKISAFPSVFVRGWVAFPSKPLSVYEKFYCVLHNDMSYTFLVFMNIIDIMCIKMRIQNRKFTQQCNNTVRKSKIKGRLFKVKK